MILFVYMIIIKTVVTSSWQNYWTYKSTFFDGTKVYTIIPCIDIEKFAGLNFRSFNPTAVFNPVSLPRSAYYLRVTLTFMEKLLQCS